MQGGGAVARTETATPEAMPGTLTLVRIGGVDVGVHYTWVFAFALIAWSLAAGFFPRAYPGFGPGTYWVIGAIAALLLFVSVLVHEGAHTVVARLRGLGVHSITLFIFGGVSNIKSEAERPVDEFLIAAVGPLTSFLVAALVWGAGMVLPVAGTPVEPVIVYLAIINVILGAFNLLPGFPLDGGRVLRSIIWASTGDLGRATRYASYAGQGMGFVLIFWGVTRVFDGELLGGIWIGLIGWFLSNAAESIRREHDVRDALRGVPVRRIMRADMPVEEPAATVRDFVFGRALRGERAALVMDGGEPAGIVSITDVKDVDHDAWASTPLSAVMTRAPLKTVPLRSDLAAALKIMVDGNINQLPVTDGSRIVGVLTRADILRYLHLRDELHLEPERT